MGTRFNLSVALVLVGFPAFLGVSTLSPSAHACSIKPYPDQFVVESAPVTDPPGPPALTLVSAQLQRSEHAPPGTGDCKDVGWLIIKLALTDGSSWPAGVGVSLALASGTLPAAFHIPSYALQTSDGSLTFGGGDDPAQPIDFTVRATAVNMSGTQSSPIEIHVVDSAKGSSGCAVVGGSRRSGAAPVMLAFLLLAFWRSCSQPRL